MTTSTANQMLPTMGASVPRRSRLGRMIVASCVAVTMVTPTLRGQAASVSPQAVLLTDVRPSGALTVLNPNDAPITVGLSTRYGWVATEGGTGRTIVRFADDSVAPANSAARLVRFAPARFQLAPGASQVVRFVAVVPPTLPDGEYWARVTVAASGASDGPVDSTVRVSGSVNIEVQTVVPLFFRKGRVATALTGTLPPVTRHQDTLRIDPQFERVGGAASIGMLRIDVLDRDNGVLTTVARQLAVYDRLAPRYEVVLPEALVRRATRVRLSVQANRPDLPEGLPLPFPPLVLTADVAADSMANEMMPDSELIDASPAAGFDDQTQDGRATWSPVLSLVNAEAEACALPEGMVGIAGGFLYAEALARGPDAGTDVAAAISPELPMHETDDLAVEAPQDLRPQQVIGDAMGDTIPAARSDSVPARRPDAPRRDTTIASRVPSPLSPAVPDDDALSILAVVYGDEELGTLFTQEGAVPNRPLLPLMRFGGLIGAQIQVSRTGSEIRLRMPSVLATEGFVDLSTGRATRQTVGGQEETRSFVPGLPRRADDDWFVDAELLEWLTGIGLRIDVGTASLLLDARRERIPRFAMQLARRDRRFATGDPLFATPPSSRERMHWGGFAPTSLSATYLHSVDNQTGDFSSAMTVGTTVFGGGLAVDLRANRFAHRTRAIADVSWMGGNPMNRYLRQWRLGTGSSTGPVAMTGRGVSLSNSPFLRSQQLGAIVRSGTAPPGAEIELTRNGQVIGVTIADSSGRWTLPMPVDFGQNTIDIAIYTAQGVTRQSTLLSLEQDLIPARTIEYGLTVQDNDTPDSECRRRLSPCGYVANADVRVGLATRYTARFGAYELRPQDGGMAQRVPYAALVASPLDWMQVRGEATPEGWWRARAVMQPSLHLRVEAGEEAMPSGAIPFWLHQQGQLRTRERNAGLTVRPLRDLGRAWVSSQWRTAEGVRGRVNLVTGTAGVRLWRTLVQATFDQVQSQDSLGGQFAASTRGASLTLPQVPRGPQWLRRSFVVLSAATDEHWRPRFVSSQLSMNLFRRLFVQGGVDWVRGSRTPAFRMQIQHQGSLAMLFQDIASGIGGGVQSTTTVMGTATMSAQRAGVQLSSDFVALRSTVSGIAYEDRNGNGRFDPTEPRLPDVAIRVAGQVVRTDEQGRYLVRGLPVMDAIPVAPALETVLAMDGRTLVPATSREWAMLVPFGETRIDVPFVAEGTIPHTSAAPSMHGTAGAAPAPHTP